jgi:hypothetical protein
MAELEVIDKKWGAIYESMGEISQVIKSAFENSTVDNQIDDSNILRIFIHVDFGGVSKKLMIIIPPIQKQTQEILAEHGDALRELSQKEADDPQD